MNRYRIVGSRCGGLIETIAKANPGSAEAASQVAIILEYEGHRLEDLGRVPEALVSYRESIATVHPFLDQPSATIMSQYLADVENLTWLQLAAYQQGAALEMAFDALARAERFSNHTPQSDIETILLGKGWALVSIAQAGANQSTEAKETAAKALKLLDSVRKPG